MHFIVKRSSWYRGHGSDPSRLLREDGQRCCIGFVGQQCGVSDDIVRGIAQVTDIADLNNQEKFPAWMQMNSKVGEAYETNDDSCIDDRLREATLKEIFAENGDSISFED
jgi:hypothetical protein